MKVKGLDEALAGMAALDQVLEQELDDVVNTTGSLLRADIIKRYQKGPASGTVYKKKNPQRTHQASAPGQAPMTDTGRLVQGTLFEKVSLASVRVFNNVQYAAALEYGHTYTRGQTIAARPAWRPAVKKIRPQYEKWVNEAIERAINRASK